MISHADDLALARLLRLASPMLPVGAFSYSQGLEPAVEQGWVHDVPSARRWIEDALLLSIARFDAPVWCRLHRAWEANDLAALAHWNDCLTAARESAEFRAETVQMGYSLRMLVLDSGEFDPQPLTQLTALQDPGFPTVFAFVCVQWQIRERQGLLGYLWAWVENQVSAAIKTVPLGQTAGQRLLASLSACLPAVADGAASMSDDEFSNCAPGLAIASCLHETQYSRLFRS